MSGSASQEPGNGALSPPVDQPETFDLESLLSKLTKTETGANSLAKALKDRNTRDVLKQRGVKIQADDDIGYNSLPLELRDQIRRCFIAIMELPRGFILVCGRCPRLAPYACIDSEWRSAVEPVTFKSLDLRRSGTKLNKDLELLERYVVGRRRHYLQHICLPVNNFILARRENAEGDGLSEENKIDAFIRPIRKLFNCVERWVEFDASNDNLRVEFQPKNIYVMFGETFSMPQDQLRVGLNKLPTTPQITDFCVSFWEPMDVVSMLILLSRMPNLRSVTIELKTDVVPNITQNHQSQTQLFFDSLPQTNPSLEALEIKPTHASSPIDNFQVMFFTAAMSYSQRLRKFSLSPVNFAALRSVFAPFSTANFNPEAPPPLVWPDLTNFTMEKTYLHPEQQDDIFTMINELTLTIGRVVKHMPRIQNLGVGLAYSYHTVQDGGLRTNYHSGSHVTFNLESLRRSTPRSPLARLSVIHENPGLDLAETVPSEEMRDLWKESISHATGAVLEIQVTCKGQGAGLVLGEITDEDTDED